MTTESSSASRTQLTGAGIVDQAALVRSGGVAPCFFIDAARDAIEESDRQLNSVTVRFTQPHVVNGLAGKPYSGVPFLLKDALCGLDGEPRTEGTRWLRRVGYRDDYDSVVVSRLRAAGFAILGRTNVPEFASSDTTEPLAAGPARNPWDLTRSTGGSSGGSAAAVAAGYVAAAHGTDASGSIRLPASWCGVFGLKPSRGLVPSVPDFGEGWGTLGFRSCHGVLSRSVRDAAAVLDVMAGGCEGGTALTRAPDTGYLAVLDRPPGRLLIGVVRQEPDWDPGVCDAVNLVARTLVSLGNDAVEMDLPRPAQIPRGRFVEEIPGAAMVALLDWWRDRVGSDPLPEDLEPVTWQIAAHGETTTAREMLATMHWHEAAGRHVASWCEQADVLLTPTTIAEARRLGRYASGDPLAELMAELATTTRFTDPFNVSGQPCISVPAGKTSSGLPCGVQIVARHGRDDLVLRLAFQLERAGALTELPDPASWSGR
jgi:amidase